MPSWKSGRHIEDIVGGFIENLSDPGPRHASRDRLEHDGVSWLMIPPDIRYFLTVMNPLIWEELTKNSEPRLLPSKEWGWCNYLGTPVGTDSIDGDPLKIACTDWHKATYFRFGAFGYGDLLMCCVNPPVWQRGCIVFGGTIAHLPIVVLGESLADWLERLSACGFFEYGAYLGELIPDSELLADFSEEEFEPESGIPTGLALSLRLEFLHDHLRLNPSDSSAMQLLDTWT